ncbi:MAG: AAA family ATPase [Candidatus Magasanikbacteria bacterium]
MNEKNCIIGHHKIIQFFNSAIQTGNLSHTYCLVGPQAVGKRAVAEYLASQLLHVPVEKLVSQSDYLYLARILDEKTEKLHKDITVKQARELRERLRSRSWLGGYQIVLIDEAELLNDEAANALLKVLEEPPQQCIIFLLTTDEQAILSTIRSRAQIIYFSLVATEEISQAMVNLGCEQELAATIAKLSWGRPGRAINLWQDPSMRQDYYNELQRLHSMIGSPFYAKLAAVEELFGKKDDDTQMKRGRWQNILKIWQVVWRDVLLYKLTIGAGVSGESDLIKYTNFSEDKILMIIDRLGKAEKLMGENINPRLLIEEAILEF